VGTGQQWTSQEQVQIENGRNEIEHHEKLYCFTTTRV
jgi:hypothetical protein